MSYVASQEPAVLQLEDGRLAAWPRPSYTVISLRPARNVQRTAE